MIGIAPLDIVVFDGTGSILHNIIEWRGLDTAVHCALAKDSMGSLYDPDFKGIVNSNLLDYTGRKISIHRYKYSFKPEKLLIWCEKTMSASEGYDYKQWLFGFVLGKNAKELADCPNKWTCAELPYWAFQENGYKLTQKEEVLPMPRFFRYSPVFTKIFEGVI